VRQILSFFLTRRLFHVGAWICGLSLALLLVGTSVFLTRGLHAQSATAHHSLIVVDENNIHADLRWMGQQASSYATNAVIFRDGVLTAIEDTTVNTSYLAALIGNSREVRLFVDELHIAPNAIFRLPGVRLNVDATEVVVAGSIDVSGVRAGSITIEADEFEITTSGRIRANGEFGGGDVFVGGQWQGSGGLRAARQIVMAPRSRIEASAIEHGRGGTVVLRLFRVVDDDLETEVVSKHRRRGSALTRFVSIPPPLPSPVNPGLGSSTHATSSSPQVLIQALA
jgi:hypothetical protein